MDHGPARIQLAVLYNNNTMNDNNEVDDYSVVDDDGSDECYYGDDEDTSIVIGLRDVLLGKVKHIRSFHIQIDSGHRGPRDVSRK